MCHGNQQQFNHCHGGMQQNDACHQSLHRYHGGSPHQPARHEDCCCSSGGFKRQFYGKEEQTAKLEKYLQDLKLETKAVEEKIKELKGGA